MSKSIQYTKDLNFTVDMNTPQTETDDGQKFTDYQLVVNYNGDELQAWLDQFTDSSKYEVESWSVGIVGDLTVRVYLNVIEI